MPERSIQIPLLLVVHVLEPRISLDTPRIDFGQTLIGLSAQRIIKLSNPEAEPFHFELDKNSVTDFGNRPPTSGCNPLFIPPDLNLHANGPQRRKRTWITELFTRYMPMLDAHFFSI
jgi:hypothetical protein